MCIMNRDMTQIARNERPRELAFPYRRNIIRFAIQTNPILALSEYVVRIQYDLVQININKYVYISSTYN